MIVMNLAIQINGHPASSAAAHTAYQFIKAALRKNHQVILVFFYYDGVFGGLRPVGGEDERHEWNDPPEWSELVGEYGLDLMLCAAAADRRGLTGRSPKDAAEPPLGSGLPAIFRVGGLGQWVDACLRCDRFVVFAQ